MISEILYILPMRFRQIATVTLAIILVTLICLLISGPFVVSESGILGLASLFLYSVLMLGAVFNMLIYLVGLFLLRHSGSPSSARGQRNQKSSSLAILMPVYNEEPCRVAMGIERIWNSIAACGLDKRADFFLLSDSTSKDIQEEEDWQIEELARRVFFGTQGSLQLIRRKNRSKYKAGNIAHFLEQFAEGYEYMLVLDADSFMAGESILVMLDRMEADPQIAILQSLVLPMRAESRFARLMQYSIHRCMPVYARGLAWFSGQEAVYWGHNALIRIAPFMAHANLPWMPGEGPLGGAILSQDIVEAALLGRAGWKVEWHVHGGGSFDELPSNIISYGRRDRRWCQGNMQHFWLMLGDRMKPGHRIYFAIGILSYLSGPLLLLLALLGLSQIVFYPTLHDLTFPWAFLACLGVLIFFPKLTGFLAFPRKATLWREVSSQCVEVVFSFLLAPLLFFMHSLFVAEILLGGKVGWGGQSRSSTEEIGWRQATHHFWMPTVMGLLFLCLALVKAPSALIYIAPLCAGWIVSIPLAVVTSRPLGCMTRWLGRWEEDLSLEEQKELGSLAGCRAQHFESIT